MDRVQRQLAQAAYAQFALEQSRRLDEIADAAKESQLLLATSNSPEWYVAAASPSASLADVAPELRAVVDDGEVAAAPPLDLVRMYAPELGSQEPAAADEEEKQPEEKPTPKPVDSGDTSRIGLLRELSDLDT